MPNLPSGYTEPPTFGDIEREYQKKIDELDALLIPRHIDEWHEDLHDVIWWTYPINEPPYIGSPLSCGHTVEMRHYIGGEGEVKTVSTNVGGWPGYHEWWTPLPTNDQMALIQSRIEAAKKAREGGS